MKKMHTKTFSMSLEYVHFLFGMERQVSISIIFMIEFKSALHRVKTTKDKLDYYIGGGTCIGKGKERVNSQWIMETNTHQQGCPFSTYCYILEQREK